MVNKHLIGILTDFLKKHPKNKFLLENSKGNSMPHSELRTIMSAIRKRYGIPFEIRGMRHLISSHCKFKLKFDAIQMKKLDDIDKQYVNEIRETPNPV